jgi:hypothetical protein
MDGLRCGAMLYVQVAALILTREDEGPGNSS